MLTNDKDIIELLTKTANETGYVHLQDAADYLADGLKGHTIALLNNTDRATSPDSVIKATVTALAALK